MAVLSEVQFTPISAAGSGNNTLVAAQGAGVKVRVIALLLVASAAVTAKFQSGAGGTDLTGAMSLAANAPLVLKASPTGYLETAANTLLNMVLGGAIQVSGCLVWVAVS